MKIIVRNDKRVLVIYSDNNAPLVGDVIALKRDERISRYKVILRIWLVEEGEFSVDNGESIYLEGEPSYLQLNVKELEKDKE